MDLGEFGSIYDFAKRGIHAEMAEICLMCGATQFLTYNKMSNMYTLSWDYSLFASPDDELANVKNFKALINELRKMESEKGLDAVNEGRNDFLIGKKLERMAAAMDKLEEIFIDVYKDDYSTDDIDTSLE